MVTTIGIDIGGSTTKIIGFDDSGRMYPPFIVRSSDPLASIYGAFGRFIAENSLELRMVERVMLTGVGSSFVDASLFGIPTGKVDEFIAIGLGGLYMSGLDKAVITSMGTGTAFVNAGPEGISHLGGTGIGGGTLIGLSSRMINMRNVSHIIDCASEGDIANVNLTVSDISREDIPSLHGNITASNFGRVSEVASKNDIALGILSLVFETIGMMAVFAAHTVGTNDVVLTGNLSTIPQAPAMFDVISDLHGINFHIPHNAEYATAIGAALACRRGVKFTEV